VRPALSISSIVFISLNKYVASYCNLPLQYVVFVLTSGSTIINNDFLVGNMQETLAYNEGYRDGLRFLFTLHYAIDAIPKEVWEDFGVEMRETNKILKELREDE